MSTRQNGARLGPASAVAALNDTAANDIQPNVRADGLEVVFSSNRTGTLGAQDIFDAVPDEFPNAGDVGNLYPTSSPIGFNGGFWYARFNMDF